MRGWKAPIAAAGIAWNASAAAQTADVPSDNWSSNIAVALTYQLLLPATAATTTNTRKTITFQNNNTNTDNCWIEPAGAIAVGNTTSTIVTTKNGTMTAAKASILLTPGGSMGRYMVYLPSGPIVGTCQNANDSIYADVQQ